FDHLKPRMLCLDRSNSIAPRSSTYRDTTAAGARVWQQCGFLAQCAASAPHLVGKGAVNPIAMLASFGMALRYSFNMGKEADLLDQAIANVLARGLRTADIKSEGSKVVTTTEMGEAIVTEMKRLS